MIPPPGTAHATRDRQQISPRSPKGSARASRRACARTAVAAACGLLAALPALPAGPDPGDGADASAGEVLKEHAWHLGAVIAAEYVAHLYSDAYGPSTDPIFFCTPGDLDQRLREEIAGSDSNNTVWDNGPEILKYATPAVIVALGWGEGGKMTRDFVGFIESHFLRRAATQLAKDLVGRERPRLEFAEEDGRGPGSIEDLEEEEGNRQSFPSGHASGAFGYASYLERMVARELGPKSTARKFSFAAFYGLAGWIAWGRLRVDKHYLTDVAAGAALGTWISRSAYRHSHPEEYPDGRVAHRDEGRRIRFLPPSPVPGGVMVTAVIRLGPSGP